MARLRRSARDDGAQVPRTSFTANHPGIAPGVSVGVAPDQRCAVPPTVVTDWTAVEFLPEAELVLPPPKVLATGPPRRPPPIACPPTVVTSCWAKEFRPDAELVL